MQAVERDSSLSSSDWQFYNVYSSKHNKENLHTLKYEMTLSEFLTHGEYVEIKEAFDEEAALREAHARQESKNRRG